MPRGRAFRAGQSGNPHGRPKGVPNKATVEARQACAEIVDNAEYRALLSKRALNGTLSPDVETMLWAYAYGKPRDTLEITGPPEIVLSWKERAGTTK